MRPRWERHVVNPHTQTRWHTLLEKLDTGIVVEKRLKQRSVLKRGVVQKKVYHDYKTKFITHRTFNHNHPPSVRVFNVTLFKLPILCSLYLLYISYTLKSGSFCNILQKFTLNARWKKNEMHT